MAGELDRDSESSRLHYNLLVYSALQDAPVTTRQWETPLVPGAKHRGVFSGQPPPVRVCTSKEEREALAWRILVPKSADDRTSSVHVGGLGCDIPSLHFALKPM